MKYATQMEAAKHGVLTEQMRQVACEEGMDEALLLQRVAAGEIAIPANIRHTSLHPYGIGTGLRTKINVNLGISAVVTRSRK